MRVAIVLLATLVVSATAAANPSGADMRGITMIEGSLEPSTSLRGARLQGATLFEVEAVGADLRGARLDRADLFGSDLRDASLAGAVFAGATCTGVTAPDGSKFPTDVPNSPCSGLGS